MWSVFVEGATELISASIPVTLNFCSAPTACLSWLIHLSSVLVPLWFKRGEQLHLKLFTYTSFVVRLLMRSYEEKFDLPFFSFPACRCLASHGSQYPCTYTLYSPKSPNSNVLHHSINSLTWPNLPYVSRTNMYSPGFDLSSTIYSSIFRPLRLSLRLFKSITVVFFSSSSFPAASCRASISTKSKETRKPGRPAAFWM